VNLLIYLADQLLKGCQSADNQVQALQNQATEGFSVHGSRLPELEAEVVQIQLFMRVSLRYLISVDQQGFGTWRIFFVPLFWATCRLFSSFLLIWILESFLSVDIITLFTLVLLRPLGGVILFQLCSFLTLCPFVTKRGE
jgi:hypothetical protein